MYSLTRMLFEFCQSTEAELKHAYRLPRQAGVTRYKPHTQLHNPSIHSCQQPNIRRRMIIEPDSGDTSKGAQAASEGGYPMQRQDVAGPSNSQLHDVESNNANEQDRLLGDAPGNYPDIVFPGPQEPLGPPPAFTPYDAEWFEVGRGDVVSHDVHLNTDGQRSHSLIQRLCC